ncbi:MAG TPA: hypothetical protein IAB74_06845 [Candidatus Faecousia excrementigallinarum]|uniref:GIY-YIG domain-containing protein n=1 Tax=Candidatus Faecousia excrementigallinarum TaxID=2840806 RepID=A0A9D0Z2V1_9FIRM|nr:hypothetical protein [Candidatus Faecousia excrementigallinarum]
MHMKPIRLKNLYETHCKDIPHEPGVYFVMASAHMEISFFAAPGNTGATGYDVKVLEKKYACCGNKNLLYIGKAAGKRGLRQRILQYMKYGWQEGVNHKGGRAIWQIAGAENLLLTWEVCQNAAAREHQLLAEFKNQNGTYPLANWRG